MGNKSSGPKKRPEIGLTGTLTRQSYATSGPSGIRLAMPDDEELEKR